MGTSISGVTADPPKKKKQAWHQHLYVRVLFAIFSGIMVGFFFPEFGASLKPLGDAFIALVKMIISPVIFLTVAAGIGGMKGTGQLGSIIGKTMGYFLAVSTLALIIGLIVGNIVQPGSGFNIDPATLDASQVEQYAVVAHDESLVGFLKHIIPTTFFSSMTSGDILQVLFVAILTGLGLSLAGDRVQPIQNFLELASEVIFKIVHIIMHLAPIGAFGAMAFTVGQYGLESIVNLAALVGTFYATSLAFVVVVLGLIARFYGFSVLSLIKYLKDELWLVLGTSSSEAALPALMEKLENAGCRKDVVGLVVPTGYSFNLDGTNIYMTLAATFIAQACGVDLSISDQLLLVVTAMISSKGAAGVTGAGFVILAATLSVVPSVPVAGMALILGVDRFMSECRALTNFMGNAVATIVVSSWEKALDRDMLASALGGEAPAGSVSKEETKVN